MTNEEFYFDTWFNALAAAVLDKCGVDFKDRDSVRDDYEACRDYADVAEEIINKYADRD